VGVHQEKLCGLLEKIIFHNMDNGYCILKIKVKGHKDLLTVVGYASTLSVGEYVEATGSWIHDKNYGLQFKTTTLNLSPPTTLEGLERYLSSGLIKGIGPVYAKKLVYAFGENIFDVIEKNPEALTTIEGIGSYRAQRITQSWEVQKAIRRLMIFLHQYGISTSKAVRIYKTFGDQAIDEIIQDPYCLAREIRGIGFVSADHMAQNLGLEKSSLKRACAGLSHVLLTHLEKGHCALPQDILLQETEKLLEIPSDVLYTALEKEILEQHLIQDVIGERLFVFLRHSYYAEKGIAQHLLSQLQGDVPWKERDIHLERIEKKLQIHLSASQRDALQKALVSKVLVITGGPGVGKTTLVRSIIEILKSQHIIIGLCAPTGRAAKRLSETTHLEAKTIHRLIDFSVHDQGFRKGPDHQLSLDLLIVDEVSMVDVSLFYALLKALPQKSALILVGDSDQLPSMGPGQVLKDLIDSNQIPVASLTEIFRQAQESQIITNAHRINQGHMPHLHPSAELSDFYYVQADQPEDALQKILEIVGKRIPKRFGFDPMKDIQVLCPMNRGAIGAHALNKALQELLNPVQDMKVERFGFIYSVGDKVMQTQNDYDKEVYNGDIGYVQEIHLEDNEIILNFDGRPIVYDFGELDQVCLAYAITIHKAQGSEYPCIVLPIMMQHYPMLSRKLLYTGITRGKNLVVLVGQKKAIASCVQEEQTQDRYTKLKQWLINRNF